MRTGGAQLAHHFFSSPTLFRPVIDETVIAGQYAHWYDHMRRLLGAALVSVCLSLHMQNTGLRRSYRSRAPPASLETNRRLVFEQSRTSSASQHEHKHEPDSESDDSQCATSAAVAAVTDLRGVGDVDEDRPGTVTRIGASPSEKPFQRLDYAADVVLGDGQRQMVSVRMLISMSPKSRKRAVQAAIAAISGDAVRQLVERSQPMLCRAELDTVLEAISVDGGVSCFALCLILTEINRDVDPRAAFGLLPRGYLLRPAKSRSRPPILFVSTHDVLHAWSDEPRIADSDDDVADARAVDSDSDSGGGGATTAHAPVKRKRWSRGFQTGIEGIDTLLEPSRPAVVLSARVAAQRDRRALGRSGALRSGSGPTPIISPTSAAVGALAKLHRSASSNACEIDGANPSRF